mgnify:CR=1 FL=1
MKRVLYVPILSMIGFLLLTIQTNATEAYPSNWFVNMKYNQVQVLLRSTNEDFSKASIAVNYPGVKVQKIHHFENGHYIAVDLEIGAMAKPGNVQFKITSSGKSTFFNWPLLQRRKNRGVDFAQGLNYNISSFAEFNPNGLDVVKG